MSIILRKHHGELAFTGIAKLGVVGLLVAFSTSFIVTIWAVYLDSFVNNIATVGFISAIFTFIGIASYFIFIPFIERTSKSKIFSYSLLVFGIAYLVFAFTRSFQIFLLTAAILTIFRTLRITSFGLIIRDRSKRSHLSKNEGLIFTFVNVAFVIEPLLAGYIADRNGINNVFILSAIFVFLAFFILRLEKIEDNRKQKKVHKDLFKNFFSFLMNLIKFFIKIFTRFSTSLKDSPFGGGVLYPLCITLYSCSPRNFSTLFLSFGERLTRESPSTLRFNACFPIFLIKDSWLVPSRSP